jgi:type IV fimbrial biogenesis protein FimT
MRSLQRRRRASGFTITEMMIVVAILGILAAIAAPHMGTMVRTQRIKTAAFDVFSSMSYARSEAIKRNTTVSVLPTGGNWAQGWRIVDSNGNVLRQQSGWEALTANGPASVVFASTGRLTNPVSNISLTSSGVEANANRCVKLDLSGRAVSKEGAC